MRLILKCLKKDAVTYRRIFDFINELEMQDIDNETDWKLAELKYSLLHKEMNKIRT